MILKKEIFLPAIIALIIFAAHQEANALTRWFKVSYGFRVGGSIIDIEDRAPDNNITYSVGFTGGFITDFLIADRIGLGIELLYSLRGGVVSSSGEYIHLHYLSLPTLAKVWLMRRRLAVTFGPVHNFLTHASGTINSPNVKINTDSLRVYDLGISIGLSFVIITLEGGARLTGDLRFEIGIVNIFDDFRPEFFNRNLPYFAIGMDF